MNKAYRLIWNRAKEVWIVAAETVKGKGGPPPLTIAALAAVASLLLAPVPAHALPTAPQVISGTANINTSGSAMTITNSANAIINWQGFSIGQNESARFIQPSALSAVLNRVTGGDPSKILGALQSNGKVLLINQNGILFGPNSRIEVNGLVASTLDITNQDFLAGRMKFNAGSVAGKVENQGTITTPGGGLVYLIAADVTNSGVITAPNGDIMLAAGKEVLLVDSSSPEIAIVVSAPEHQAINLGTLVADAGRIGVYGGIVRQKGRVSADSAVSEGGRIFLKATKVATLEKGSITTAKGEHGGTVQVLGEHAGLIDNAIIDVSGTNGGGTVLVGGDYQGKNPLVLNADATYFGKDSTIKADATETGNGGKVIIWSDDRTRAYGSISAKGGVNGGDGGFVEVSGKNSLDFIAKVDATASKGLLGTLLLDPANITVSNVNPTTTTYTDVNLFTAQPGTDQVIAPATLQAVGASVDLQATANISFSDALTLSTPGAGLTASAGGSIAVNAPITTSGGTINLTANDIQLSAPITAANSGRVTIKTSTAGRPINLGTETVGSLSLTAAELNNITTTGALQIGDYTNGGAINLSASIAPTNVAMLDLESASSITQTAGGIAIDNLALRSKGNVDITAVHLNFVNTLAAVQSGGSYFSFANTANNLTVGTVDGLAGISAPNALTLMTWDSNQSIKKNLTVNNNITANGTIQLTLYNANAGSTLINNATISSPQSLGEVNISAGDIVLNSGSNIVAGKNLILVAQNDFDLGTHPVIPTRLSLAQADLNYITTPEIKINGGGTLGSVYVTGDIDMTSRGINTLKIHSWNSLSGTGKITVPTLALQASYSGGSGSGGVIDVVTAADNIAAMNTYSSTGNSIKITNTAPSGTLSIVNIPDVYIGGVNGVSSGTAITNITENSTGTGKGNITATAAPIVASGLTVAANGNVTLSNASNSVSSFNATNSGSGDISLTNSGTTLSITGISQSGTGNVSVTNSGGITTTGNITLAGGTATLIADANDTGTGTLTIGSGKLVTTNGGTINIKAADIDLQGEINSGIGDVNISARANGTASTNGSITVGTDTYVREMTISDTELRNITAGNLILNAGSGGNKEVSVGGITATDSDNIGKLTLMAQGADSSVSFRDTGTVVKALEVKSDEGIYIFGDITTTTGNVQLNSTGTVTQNGTGSITAAGLELLGAGAIYQLDNSSNQIGILAGNTGTVTLVNSQELTIGSVNSSSGLTTTGNISLTATGLSGQDGIVVASQLSSIGSNITLKGIGGSGNGSNASAIDGHRGVVVSNDISTTTGNISITGDGGNGTVYTDSEFNSFIGTGGSGVVINGGIISTTATVGTMTSGSKGAITISGTGGIGAPSEFDLAGSGGHGVEIIGASITTNQTITGEVSGGTVGTITVVGTGGSGGISAEGGTGGTGVVIDGGTISSTNILSFGGSITTGATVGAISITGTGASGGAGLPMEGDAIGGDGGYGIKILSNSSSSTITSDSASISLVGTGGYGGAATTGDYGGDYTYGGVGGDGISLNASTEIITDAGSITLAGTGGYGGAASGGDYYDYGGMGGNGVSLNASLNASSKITTNTGNIVLNGTGGSGYNCTNCDGPSEVNKGVFIGGEVTSTDSGSVNINGFGGSDIDGRYSGEGVVVDLGGKVGVMDGTLTIIGTGGNGTAENGNSGGAGVVVHGDLTSTGTGNISVIGYGGLGSGSGDGGYGVYIDGTVSSTYSETVTDETAAISITGTGGHSMDSGTGGAGVYLDSFYSQSEGEYLSDALISSSSGNIKITGIGGHSPVGNSVYIDYGNWGYYDYSGFGGSGVYVGTKSGVESAGSGAITINGTGGNAYYGRGDGIFIDGSVTSTGSGAINITGTGGNGMDAGNDGYEKAGSGVSVWGMVASGYSEISIIGQGGVGIGVAGGDGVLIKASDGPIGTVQSTGASSNISITGTGGYGTIASGDSGDYSDAGGKGINADNATIDSTSGGITLKGLGGNGSDGLYLNVATIGKLGTSNVTLIGDSISVDQEAILYVSSIKGKTLNIEPFGNSTTIGIGGGDGALNPDPVLAVASGFTDYIIGKSNTGNGLITVGSSGLNVSGVNFTLQNPGSGSAGISIDGSIITNANLTLNTTGTVTQTASIQAAGLELLGTGATYLLGNSSNSVVTLAGNTSSVYLKNSTGLSIGTVNTIGLTADNDLTLNLGSNALTGTPTVGGLKTIITPGGDVPAMAQTCTSGFCWIGATDSDWNNPANWLTAAGTSAVPTTGTVVKIGTIGNLANTPGYAVNVNASSALVSSVTSNEHINISSGNQLNLSAASSFNRTLTLAAGTLNTGVGATTISTLALGSGSSVNGTGSLTVSHDITDMTGAFGSGFTDISLTKQGSFNVNGNLTASRNLTLSAQGAGADLEINANLTKSGKTTGTFTLKADNAVIIGEGKSIGFTAGSGKVDVILNANAADYNAGNIHLLQGASIRTNGGNIVMGGGTCDSTECSGAATGHRASNAQHEGIFLGATINSSSQFTVLLDTSATIGTGGNILMNGKGLDGAVGANGIYSAFTTMKTGGGNVTIAGTGGSSTSSNNGVYFDSSTRIATDGGTINISGNGGGASADSGDDYGIYTNGTTLDSSKNGNIGGMITLTGRGGYGTVSEMGEIGVYLDEQTRIISGGAALDIKGYGGFGDNSTGIHTYKANLDTSRIGNTGGSVTLTGTRGVGYNSNEGIDLAEDTKISSGGGNITITGIGTGFGDNNYGIDAYNATVDSGGGKVTLEGTGGNGTYSNTGVYLDGTLVTTNGGELTVTGHGGNATVSNPDDDYSSNYGIYTTNTTFDTGTIDGSVAGGKITLTGTGGTGTSYEDDYFYGNNGIYLEYTNIKTGGNDLWMTGSGGGKGAGSVSRTDYYANDGIYTTNTLLDTSRLGQTDGGNINITGYAGNGSSANNGVNLYDGTNIKTGGGTLEITGYGGRTLDTGYVGGTDQENDGIRTYHTTIDTSRLNGETGGAVTLNGWGGNGTGWNVGVYLDGSFAQDKFTSITTGGGNLDVNGYGGNALLLDSSLDNSSNHGIYTNSSTLDTSSLDSNKNGGNITLYGIGGIGASSPPDFGGVNGVHLDWTNIITGGGNLDFTGSGGGGSSVGDFTFSDNYGIYTYNATLDTSSRSANGIGGNLTLIGTGGTGAGGSNIGVYLDGSFGSDLTSITTGGGDLSIAGVGGSTGTTSNYGIKMYHSTVDSGAGTMTLTGIGGAGAESFYLDSGAVIGGHVSCFGECLSLFAPQSGNVTLIAGGSGINSIAIANRDGNISGINAINGTGTLNLRPLNLSGSVTIGGTGEPGGLNLNADALSAIKLDYGDGTDGFNGDGFKNVVIGNALGTGKITVAGDGWNVGIANLTLQNAGVGSAGMAINGPISASVESVVSNVTITLPIGNITLNTTGTVTQTSEITAAGLELFGTGGNYQLTSNGNNVTTLAGNTGNINFNGSDIEVGTVNRTVGLTASGNVTLTASTATQSAPIVASGLVLIGGYGGHFTLEDVNNRVATLAGAYIDDISFTNNGDFAIGTVNSTSGLSASNITLNTIGIVTQSAPINVTNTLDLQGANATYLLGHSANIVATLTGNTSSVYLKNNRNLTINNGLTVNNDVTLDIGSHTWTGAPSVDGLETIITDTGVYSQTCFADYCWIGGSGTNWNTPANWLTNFTATLNGTVTQGNALITNLTDTTGMKVGMPVSGTGIPAGATILSIESNSITLSANGTETGTTQLNVNVGTAPFSGANVRIGTISNHVGTPDYAVKLDTAATSVASLITNEHFIIDGLGALTVNTDSAFNRTLNLSYNGTAARSGELNIAAGTTNVNSLTLDTCSAITGSGSLAVTQDINFSGIASLAYLGSDFANLSLTKCNVLTSLMKTKPVCPAYLPSAC